MKRAVRRRTALLVLALSLTAATTQAAPFPRAVPEPTSLLAAAWNWIVLHALPAPKPALTPISEKAGCEIDPNGHMRCDPAAPMQIDAGCDVDPNGAHQ